VLRLLSLRYLQEKGKPFRQKNEVRSRLIDMATEEMQTIYMDAYQYYGLRLAMPLCHREVDLMKDAINNKRHRFALFVLDMLSLIDNTGALLAIERNFKILEDREKANVIELIETFGEKNISRFLVPILEEYSERELLKIGSQKWPYQPVSLEVALAYFKALDNRWILFVSLYLERVAKRHAH